MRLVVGDYILTYDLIADDVAISSIRHARQSDPDIAHDAVVEFEVDADRSSIDEPDD